LHGLNASSEIKERYTNVVCLDEKTKNGKKQVIYKDSHEIWISLLNNKKFKYFLQKSVDAL